jgi:hypothetical protein
LISAILVSVASVNRLALIFNLTLDHDLGDNNLGLSLVDNRTKTLLELLGKLETPLELLKIKAVLVLEVLLEFLKLLFLAATNSLSSGDINGKSIFDTNQDKLFLVPSLSRLGGTTKLVPNGHLAIEQGDLDVVDAKVLGLLGHDTGKRNGAGTVSSRHSGGFLVKDILLVGIGIDHVLEVNSSSGSSGLPVPDDVRLRSEIAAGLTGPSTVGKLVELLG